MDSLYILCLNCRIIDTACMFIENISYYAVTAQHAAAQNHFHLPRSRNYNVSKSKSFVLVTLWSDYLISPTSIT